MTKISTYSNDATITITDKIIGTDGADSSTKNYTVENLGIFFSTYTETLQNKTMDFSSGGNNTLTADSDDILFDNAISGLSATDVKAALDEVALGVSGAISVSGANTSAIATNTSNISTNASNISTNASNISSNTSAIAGKADALVAGTNLTAGVNLSSLVADEYSADDTGGGVTITIDDTANTNFGTFESRWVHYIFSSAGLTVNTSGSQSVVGNTSWGSTGSYRITKIGANSWMVS